MTPVLYNLSGLKCPLPVIKTRKKLAAMASGTLIRVDTTDPLAVIDMPHFCNEDGHELVETEKTENGHRFLIRKR
ncbi:tRNA 2-thiouridine synthesizing protein A [Rhizobium leguminosarum]|uniref:tRNA 2-thiouridine synthesizing protein A n=1 Tax=Rhizobium leguminosarum TaxID=384 RepID=A0AAE2MMJ3_RHILE|nr:MULTISPECIES: sulfurtransferase TusA family protein [Rhizobium]MBB4291909.1 tRNA 2-thiouridine synthesizing protein A [Rhizobium leguminosarum]MBB4298510.1 tRNA 2-thiouridine synthesizing protein A [Rhizobium leguminosarum]MBB4309648.1 tRNA 2-thiouridine synthesizing protein A [Rhizobium leguminosarum]MBB4419085.1 tRNA 2-thiouridine synthesizing protein A [Rhizobium leguminosarum]MBB4433584.1 tRNA 2-thiouridine synthesizing protein A [Rhizobium esperanzae]